MYYMNKLMESELQIPVQYSLNLSESGNIAESKRVGRAEGKYT